MPQHKLRFLPRYRNTSRLVVSPMLMLARAKRKHSESATGPQYRFRKSQNADTEEIRTTEWRNQNPSISPVSSTPILKIDQNSTVAHQHVSSHFRMAGKSRRRFEFYSSEGKASFPTAPSSFFVQRTRSAKSCSSISTRPSYSAKLRSLWALRKICMSDWSVPKV